MADPRVVERLPRGAVPLRLAARPGAVDFRGVDAVRLLRQPLAQASTRESAGIQEIILYPDSKEIFPGPILAITRTAVRGI